MNKLIKINENSNLSRDLSNTAIINTSVNALERAKQIKAKKLNDSKRIDILENKIDKILELLEK